jgi:hypothetical protein
MVSAKMQNSRQHIKCAQHGVTAAGLQARKPGRAARGRIPAPPHAICRFPRRDKRRQFLPLFAFVWC